MSKPTARVQSLIFSDSTEIEIGPKDIVVLVGPNNCGKTAALRDIHGKVKNAAYTGIAVKGLGIRPEGTVEDLVGWLEQKMHVSNDNPADPAYRCLQAAVGRNDAKNRWQNPKNGLESLRDFFLQFLDTEARLAITKAQSSISPTKDAPSHPVHHMYRDEKDEKIISDYFNEAFGQELIVHHKGGKEIPLHCGKRPVPEEGCDRASTSYCEVLDRLPRLDSQGDGMRCFAGVAMYAFLMDFDILLIDEPEAFLHPPQARLMGRMLAQEGTTDRQIFIATHSGDILRGLLDSNSERVRVIRLTRERDVNRARQLSNAEIAEVWRSPLLRYSNVLDGLFHDAAIVCEADADCRFYAAMLDALYDQVRARPDVMLLHGGGKDRVHLIANSLRSLGVRVLAICDFDVLNAEKPLRRIYKTLGGDWGNIEADWKAVKAFVEKQNPSLSAAQTKADIGCVFNGVSDQYLSREDLQKVNRILKKAKPWSAAKTEGKHLFKEAKAKEGLDRLLKTLKDSDFFVVEVGELESFAPSVGGDGARWVSSVLEKNLLQDPELENARSFMRSLIEGLQSTADEASA